RNNPTYLLQGGGVYGIMPGDYYTDKFTIDGADIQGYEVGFQPSLNTGGGTQTIQNSLLRNAANVYLCIMATSNESSALLKPRKTIISNVMFLKPTIDIFGTYYSIMMDGSYWNEVMNYILPDNAYVYIIMGSAEIISRPITKS